MNEKIKEKIRKKQHERKSKIWEDCICGSRYSHSIECKQNHRRNQKKWYVVIHRLQRQEKRKNHICIIPGCTCKGEREIVIHQFCKKHRKQQQEYNRKFNQKNIERHQHIPIFKVSMKDITTS